MAHELEMVDGKASMAWAGETPWHGLGTKVPADLTPEQMMEAAGLNWGVKKRPMYIREGSSNVRVPNTNMLIRDTDSKMLSIVTDSWKPCQNSEAFKFFNDFVAAGDMEMHTAGALKDGKIVWALAKINDSFELFGGDKVDGYLLFSNPHEFGKSIDIQFTPIRVVCNNTLTLSLSKSRKNQVKVTHRHQFDGEKVKEMMGIAHDKLEKYKEMAEHLGGKRYTNETVTEYFNRLFPTASKEKTGRNVERALELLTTQPGHEFAEGTWWQAFNAVTFITNHEKGHNTSNRLQSLWHGAGRDLNLQAMELALEMAV